MALLQQTKLTRNEWNSIEKPIHNKRERDILDIINLGYMNPDIQMKNIKCMRTYMKLDTKYDKMIYDILLKDKLKDLDKNDILGISKYCKKVIEKHTVKKLKLTKSDMIRFDNSVSKFELDNLTILEYECLKIMKQIYKIKKKDNKKYQNHKKFGVCVFNLNTIICNARSEMNIFLFEIIRDWNENNIEKLNYDSILENISFFLRNNNNKELSESISLYPHQKKIYEIFKNNLGVPKFIWYCAPTSSGKTLTPLGLTNQYKVIFMCASKHIGINLAKSAYQLGKKIGFAFGCDDVSDIRLNYNAISKYEIMKNGKKKPDHTDGTNVELIVCDLKSYEIAMLYMKAFHRLQDIILFWDEPTIGLDVESHYLHSIIETNWKTNVIPNVIFSCATLPKIDEIQNVIHSFKNKHSNCVFDYVTAHDITNNVILFDINYDIIMPHNQFPQYDNLIAFIDYQGKKYYKFYDFEECCKFIWWIKNNKKYSSYYTSTQQICKIEHIDNLYLKDIYINVLKNIKSQNTWTNIYNEYNSYSKNEDPINKTKKRIGIDITTSDAHNLTHGPTLFLSNNISKLSDFFVLKSGIDISIINSIIKNINENNELQEVICKKERDYNDKIEKFKDNENVMMNMRFPKDVLDLHNEIENLRSKIKLLSLSPEFIPNTRDHYNKWCTASGVTYEESNAFSGHVSDDFISKIVSLTLIHPYYKILLMMGIGIFTHSEFMRQSEYEKEVSPQEFENEIGAYVEIIKELAENKELYLIVADSDYIYGTNYQFSHSYLGKDLNDITQEKIIQCIGRVGRQDKTNNYTFRFRSQEHIKKLYEIPIKSIETINMNKLFT